MADHVHRGGKSQIRMAGAIYGEKRERHMEFLAESLDDIMAQNAICFAEYGRGLWLFRDAPNGDGSQGAYVDNLSILPDDDIGRRIKGMVAMYTPATQAVVVLFEDEDNVHAYTIGARSEGQ